MATTLMICGAMAISFSLTSCKETKAQDDSSVQQVRSTEMFRTSQSWDGVELPDYPEGRPELVAVRYEIPAGLRTLFLPQYDGADQTVPRAHCITFIDFSLVRQPIHIQGSAGDEG